MIVRILICSLCIVLIWGCVRRAPSPIAPHDDPQPTSHDAITVPAPSQRRVVHLSDDLSVHLDAKGDSFVEVKGVTCLDEGYLEQIACAPGTREHESLVVVRAKPSQIHGALLMAGFESGAPARWSYDNNTITAAPPTGDKVEVRVRHIDEDGTIIEQPIRNWIRAARLENQESPAPIPFPSDAWVFGGSTFAPNSPAMGPGEHYVADVTGSIVGLVTFGDEVLGFSRVLSDQADVQPLEWEVNTHVVPPMETPVTLVLRKWKEPGAGEVQP